MSRCPCGRVHRPPFVVHRTPCFRLSTYVITCIDLYNHSPRYSQHIVPRNTCSPVRCPSRSFISIAVHTPPCILFLVRCPLGYRIRHLGLEGSLFVLAVLAVLLARRRARCEGGWMFTITEHSLPQRDMAVARVRSGAGGTGVFPGIRPGCGSGKAG